MKWEHLQAFLWLRWRLLVHQIRRGGIVGTVFLALLLIGLAMTAVGAFFGCLLIGFFLLGNASATTVMYAWDGFVFVFLFAWCMGLVNELQRAESLALDKFLHLPVSLTGVFLINYVSSLLSVNLAIFVPAALGLTLGLVLGRGPGMLLLLPLLAAFFLAVTALTYQLQGWLASLMTNKRRRRTILVAVTAIFILIAQSPQLINILAPWNRVARNEQDPKRQEQELEMARQLGAGKITLEEVEARRRDLDAKDREHVAARDRELTRKMAEVVLYVNVFFPPGWLPLGALYAVEGNVGPLLLGTLGFAVIGAASLWRAYRTTLRLYTGHYTSGVRKPVPAMAAAPVRIAPKPNLLEKRLPRISEQAQAIALGGFRSLLRAPEVKMLLLTPVIMAGIFGSVLLTQAVNIPELVRPLVAFGAMATVLLGTLQLVGNQFGFDRSGFRVYVLCAADRRDILLGKNLAIAPLVLGMGAFLLLVLEVLYPMRPDHFLAVLCQSVTMFLLFCMLANLMSILAPMPIAAGSLRPANPRVLSGFIQMFLAMFLPLLLGPVLIPLGIEFALVQLEWGDWFPTYLVLSLIGCVVVVLLYRLVLTWEGRLLQARELKILETVVSKTE